MIVKLKEDTVYKNTWTFISGITSFRYAKITEEQALTHRKRGGLNDFIQSRDKPDNTGRFVKNEIYIYLQAWHQRSSDPINIISNMSTFILDDLGKTIERIN